MNLKPITLLPARERIAASLRKAIIGRDMMEGEQITLDAIAGLLGVSKTPVREAFLMLESEGLIKLMPNRGAVVLGITPSTVQQHFHIRAALESEAAMMCCEPAVDISPIQDVYLQSQEVISQERMEDYSNLNQAFHVAIWRCSGNERMTNMLSVMWNGLSMRYMESLEDYAKKSFGEHGQMLQCIETRNGEMARKMMYNHIMRSMNDMLTNLEKDNQRREEQNG
ncbi:MAG: GntR family transcriptional regulator [Clostridia bacterium]